jgi:hypothetical protein
MQVQKMKVGLRKKKKHGCFLGKYGIPEPEVGKTTKMADTRL